MMGLISIVGLGLIGYSRYEGQHPATTTTTTTTSLPSAYYTALTFDVCGKVSTLPVSTNTTATIVSTGNGIVALQPKTVKNPTLQTFVADYEPKMVLTSTELQLPGKKETLWKNGALCGKTAGTLQIDTWTSVSAPDAQPFTKGPSALKLENGQMIMVAFVAAGTTIPRPPEATQQELLLDLEAASQPTTTTVVPATTTTVKGGTTTTVKGGTTTTVKGGTTTTVAGSTTTTSQATTTTTSSATTTTSGATTTTAAH
jgi:hypothetical protein